MRQDDWDKQKPFSKQTNIVFRKEVMYDINTLPTRTGVEPAEMFELVMQFYKDSGILLYDSNKGGKEPVFTEKELKR